MKLNAAWRNQTKWSTKPAGAASQRKTNQLSLHSSTQKEVLMRWMKKVLFSCGDCGSFKLWIKWVMSRRLLCRSTIPLQEDKSSLCFSCFALLCWFIKRRQASRSTNFSLLKEWDWRESMEEEWKEEKWMFELMGQSTITNYRAIWNSLNFNEAGHQQFNNSFHSFHSIKKINLFNFISAIHESFELMKLN